MIVSGKGRNKMTTPTEHKDEQVIHYHCECGKKAIITATTSIVIDRRPTCENITPIRAEGHNNG